ncbi:hypothetical protein LOOC260_108500 [Paucilactobacillus hokkaidonensis JCM 18461]|uniref:Integral membrane protein n=2 Tax=Paucilactobacillus hokkaidonensis TaxID=1193095 RepID=A0A0A1GTR0_9LACO|nr:DUF1700 domain-containing protein [Paucilactobacillus hokkaidonensis]KRO10099.1 hypothetical protein IV59_GL002120 [Paucilactobacillus hokkaidonensis]BAP85390.1 hypothetical protein LOOC260_108500 [Paucilactobacillus hokkaidonensis JCM 18461]
METNPYIQELAKYLTQLTKEEQADVLEFYSEYILDAQMTSEAMIIHKLGTPKQLSRKILADYSIRNLDNEEAGKPHYEPKSKKNIRMIWLVLLALLASPVAIPIVIAIIGVLIGFFVAIVAIFIALIVTILGIVVAGVAAIVGGIMVWSASIPTSVFFMGIGVTALGLMLIIAPIGYLVIKTLIQMMANFTSWIYNRYVKNKSKQKSEAA